MSKVKSGQIPHYELLYLISNKFSENEVEPIKARVEKLITDAGGEITYREDWGKKKLAYPIKTFRHGYYILLEFNLPGAMMPKVNDKLRLSADILRHMIIKIKFRTAEEIAAASAKHAAHVKAEAEHEQALEEKKRVKAQPAASLRPARQNLAESDQAPTEVKEKKAKKDMPKIELRDLDEKLDEILDAQNLL